MKFFFDFLYRFILVIIYKKYYMIFHFKVIEVFKLIFLIIYIFKKKFEKLILTYSFILF